MCAYDTNWTKRAELTVNSSEVDADLTDYPIYVDLSQFSSGHGFWSAVQTDGDDIRVTSSDGETDLPVDIVAIDTASEVGHIFFKAAGTLSSSSNTTFYLYYGNSGATKPAEDSTYGSENVWTNYHWVHHMNGAAYTDLDDSTSNDIDISAEIEEPTYEEAGYLSGGDSVLFLPIGGADALEIAAYTNPSLATNKFAFAGWCKYDETAGNKTLFSSKWNGLDGATAHALGTAARFQIRINNITKAPYKGGVFTSAGVWYHFAGYYDGTNVRMIVDGVQEATTPATGNVDNNGTLKSYIGSDAGSSWRMRGHIDHTWISSNGNTCSNEYISTTHNNQSNPSSFITIGAEEDVGVAPATFIPRVVLIS
jgi:hypothetical protein